MIRTTLYLLIECLSQWESETALSDSELEIMRIEEQKSIGVLTGPER